MTSVEAALEALDTLSDQNANHNCWAYRVGDQYRFSDDGEPGGTAGRPILAAIEAQGIDGVMVVVTRHFGGIKLGVGGLVRAYGGTAAECLRTAPQVDVWPTLLLSVQVPYDATGAVYAVLDKLNIERVGEEHTAQGQILVLRLEHRIREILEESVRNATRGRAQISQPRTTNKEGT